MLEVKNEFKGKETTEVKTCENCRHQRDSIHGQHHPFGGIGGDCNNCDDTLSEWMPLKIYNPNVCAKCAYEEDPCHYDCVKCQDGKNFTLKPTYGQEVFQKIEAVQNNLIALKNELKIYEDNNKTFVTVDGKEITGFHLGIVEHIMAYMRRLAYHLDVGNKEANKCDGCQCTFNGTCYTLKEETGKNLCEFLREWIEKEEKRWLEEGKNFHY